VEPNEEHPTKSQLFFAEAADKWDAYFYAKVNDDVYVNIRQFVWSQSKSIFWCLKCLGNYLFLLGQVPSELHLLLIWTNLVFTLGA